MTSLTRSTLLALGAALFLTLPVVAKEETADAEVPTTPHVMLTYASITVDDYDAAIAWYTEHLDMTVTMDFPSEDGSWRWVTLQFPGATGTELALHVPGEMGEAEMEAMPEMGAFMQPGPVGNLLFGTNDCRAMGARLKEAGATIYQEPTEQFYGVECIWADPWGNTYDMVEATPLPGMGEDGADGG